MAKLGALACAAVAALAVAAPGAAADGPQVAWTVTGSAGVQPTSSARLLAVNEEGTGALLSVSYSSSNGLGTLRATPVNNGRMSGPARTLALDGSFKGLHHWAVGPTGEVLVALEMGGPRVVSFAHGAWGAVTPVAQMPGENISAGVSLDVCIDAHGNAFAAWVQLDPAIDRGQVVNAYVAERAADGTWGPPIELGPSYPTTFDQRFPVALACTGNRPLVAWQEVGVSQLRLAERGDQGWVPAGNVPLPGPITSDFRMIASGASAAIAWHSTSGAPGTWVASRRAGAWTAQRLSTTGTDQPPELARTPQSRFVVAWQDRVGRLFASALAPKSPAWSRRIAIARASANGAFSVAAPGRTAVATFEGKGQVLARTFDLGRLRAGPPAERIAVNKPGKQSLGGDLANTRLGLLTSVELSSGGSKSSPTFLVSGVLH